MSQGTPLAGKRVGNFERRRSDTRPPDGSGRKSPWPALSDQGPSMRVPPSHGACKPTSRAAPAVTLPPQVLALIRGRARRPGGTALRLVSPIAAIQTWHDRGGFPTAL